MSEGNQGTKEDENNSLSGSDDSLDEIIDIENGPQGSDSYPSVSSEQCLLGYVASGIDVQTSDILMFESLSDEIHAGSSDEILTSPSNECEINLDEEKGSQIAYTYFDNSDLCQEDLQNLEASSFSQNTANYQSSSNTCNKKEENNSGCIEGTIDAGNKNKMKEMPQEEISSTEKQKRKSQVIENPCTQIFKFMHPKTCEKSFLENNKSDLRRCPDYESDEFADVEDNAKDSSSDNNESTSNMRGLMIMVQQDGKFFPQGRDVDEQGNNSMDRLATEFPDSSEIGLLKDVSSAGHPSQSYNIGASCSHTPDLDPKQVPDFTGPAKSEENKVKFKMPTIADVADLNHRMSPKDNKSSRHKPNPLKMKTKVGMSKDKCNVCRVRLGLCAIRCRCGGYYCAKHRYDKEHNCTFDYKSMGAEEIRKNNPRIVAEKVRKL